METSFPSTILIENCPNNSFNIAVSTNPNVITFRCRNKLSVKGRRRNPVKIAAAIVDPAAAVEPAQAQVTWQIVVGALAGVTPFVVAGIEFSKRIVAQRTCGVCSGSGLVRREEYYFRCPRCGGFLPWQSWKRFFSG